MRAGLAAFWILVAVLEIYQRADGQLPGLLVAVGPWVVLAMTILPLVEAVRDFRDHEPAEGIKSMLWVVLGVVTLLLGPEWLRLR
jgi:hypothetical protein